MNLKQEHFLRRRGFTLIELLAVIAIIGIVAAMVVGMTRGASISKKNQRVKAELNGLVAMINNYQARLGHYPPDSPTLVTLSAADTNYDRYTQLNSLLYELTGAMMFTSNNTIYFQGYDGLNYPSINFGCLGKGVNSARLGGVANSDPSGTQDFYKPPPKPAEYLELPGWLIDISQAEVAPKLAGLVVPVDMIEAKSGVSTPTPVNFWHYDASSTNRHNQGTYDLWAEYVTGRDSKGNWIYVTNGNW